MRSNEVGKSRIKELASLIARWFRLPGDDCQGGLSAGAALCGATLDSTCCSKSNLRSPIDQIQSIREALIYICDELLPGLLDFQDFSISEWQEVFDALDRKYQDLLGARVTCDSMDNCPDLEEIRTENSELKARIEHLHTLHLKASPETDIALKQEVESSRRKLKDQQSHLELAAKKVKELAQYRDMFQKLKAEHTLVRNQMDHQSTLLRSLTAENPKHEQMMLSKIEELTEENRHLKLKLEQKSELLSRIKAHLPAESRQMIERLIEKNIALIGNLEEKSAQLARTDGDSNLMDHFDRLNQENAHLKRIEKTRKRIDDFISGQGKNDPGEVIEILEIENQRMESSLSDTEEIIQNLATGSPAMGLIEAYASLRRDYRQVFLENQCKDQVFRNQEDEKRWLRAQVREKTALIKKNQILEMEIQSTGRIWEDRLRKMEDRCQDQRKETLDIRSKFEKTLSENESLRQQLTRLDQEHKSLMKQLDTVFADSEFNKTNAH